MTIKTCTGLILGAAIALAPVAANAGSRSTAAIPSAGNDRGAQENHGSQGGTTPPRGLLNGYEHANDHGRRGIERGHFGEHFKSRGC